MNYHRKIKIDSEIRIIFSLFEKDMRFTELFKETKLSKPVLSERLKNLILEGKIKLVPDIKNKRFFYSLTISKEFFLKSKLTLYLMKSREIEVLQKEIDSYLNEA